MARSVNKVIIVGKLGKDAETKFTTGGIAMTRFTVATSRRWKDKDSGDWKEETDWHTVMLWRQESLGQYLTKGKQVYVEGKLQTRTYEKDGEKRYSTEVVADEVILLGGDKQESAPRQSQPQPKPQRQAEPPHSFAGGDVSDDDMPF